ncbi:hypothetical protein [Cellulomonas sp. FA1]|uniref:hypothetical protein n=1 Tax=Cellulomonas sp. FA1 TaxID=1346710 RepID=UPI003FA4241A
MTPERAGAVRARAVPVPPDVTLPVGADRVLAGRELVAVPYRLGWELAEEVVGYGDAVVVLEPADVRDQVVGMLRVAATLDRAGARVSGGVEEVRGA